MERVLLFAGSKNDFSRIKSFFSSWNGEKIELIGFLKKDGEIVLHGIKKFFVEMNDNTTENISGMNGDDMFLVLTIDGRRIIVGLLEGLEVTDKPGHQYFVTKGQAIELMFSKDEYAPLKTV